MVIVGGNAGGHNKGRWVMGRSRADQPTIPRGAGLAGAGTPNCAALVGLAGSFAAARDGGLAPCLMCSQVDGAILMCVTLLNPMRKLLSLLLNLFENSVFYFLQRR